MAERAQYTDQSITSLKGADRVRKRPGVMLGSDGLEGCEQAFFEILSNSVDEAREGFGKRINVKVFADHSIEVEDFGRGIPLGYNEKEKRFNWELVFCELYAGSKYDNATGGTYKFSLGLNGLGACATQYSSEYMHVTVYAGGHESRIDFQKGEPVSKLKVTDYPHRRTGTVIRWRPDLEVFTDIAIPKSYYMEVLKRQATINAGLTFHLEWEVLGGANETASFCYPNGILDYVREIAGDLDEEAQRGGEQDEELDAEIAEVSDEGEADEDAPRAKKGRRSTARTLTLPVFWDAERRGRDRDDQPEYELYISAALCFSNAVSRIEYYHNSSFLEHGGAPEKAVKSAFLKAIDNYLKNNGKYNKTEQKVTFADIEDCLILVTNCLSTYISFEHQTKKSVTNPFIAEAMTEFFLHHLEVYFAEHPADAERVATQVMINKRSRESAESARINIKKRLGATLDISNRVEKFAGCRSRDPNRRELFIVEGDSALASCKMGRDAEFQAIIPVRGKTLNCLKSSYDKIFKSDIIMDLLRVIGCGVEIHTKATREFSDFNLEDLKWSKIILCTDADVDGYQIRTLILTMFYRLLPSLIRAGKVYIAESPLYEITAKGETYFAYDEQEKAKVLETLGAQKYTVQRSKGLGENEAEMMWQTTMCPASRRLVRILPEDEQKTYEMFNLLLGDDALGRKKYIEEHGHEYLALADV